MSGINQTIHIDYDSLLQGAQSLDGLYNEVHPAYINKLSPLYEELLTLDDNHDDCFSSEEEGLYAINDEITKNNTNINELSIDINKTVTMFVEAELGIIDSIELLDEDNKLKEFNVKDLTIQSKGLGTAFLNRTDYSADLHGMYENKKEGPLTEEEWEKQNEILKKLMASGKTQREKAVIYATYIATMYPNKLYYYLGGQHCKEREQYLGLDPIWGYPIENKGRYYMDCSAFVLRCLINGDYGANGGKFSHPDYYPQGYDVSAEDLKNQGRVTSFTDNSDVRAGDIVNITGGGGANDHVGIIIDVDKNSNTMTVAHSSGKGGMNLTTIDMETGQVVQDSNDPSREGKTYFQTITRIPYEDGS